MWDLLNKKKVEELKQELETANKQLKKFQLLFENEMEKNDSKTREIILLQEKILRLKEGISSLYEIM